MSNVGPQSGAAPATQSGGQQDYAVYISESDLQTFIQRYQQELTRVRQLEADSKSLDDIAAANLHLATTMNGFLQAVRTTSRGQGSAGPGMVLVGLDEMRALELEAQMRVVRANAVSQAKSLDLGSVVVSSLDQKRLQQDIQREIQRLNEGGPGSDSSGSSDESQEERHPEKVDLDRSEGLYSIIDAQQAPGLDELVGYSNEAATLLNLTRDIRFVGRGINETGENASNRPIAIILYGPPGTGKTTSAQAVAKTLGFTYMYVNAENITSMWAGGTQKNIATVFRRARIAARRFNRKTLLLIDEVDGLLKNRQGAAQLTGEEYSRITTFLQMLTPPVGIDNSGIVCMFTTNNLENLDPAFVNRARQSLFLGYLIRPEDRATLFQRLLSPYVKSTETNWLQLGYLCPEFVPRDIVNLVSLTRTVVARRFEQSAGNDARQAGQTVVVPLNNNDLLLSLAELYDLTHSMNPATPVSAYFDYNPPPQHITEWLRYNDLPNGLVRPNVVDAFRRAQRGQ